MNELPSDYVTLRNATSLENLSVAMYNNISPNDTGSNVSFYLFLKNLIFLIIIIYKKK